jgi:lipopolysaccharide export system ATP-binding protein
MLKQTFTNTNVANIDIVGGQSTHTKFIATKETTRQMSVILRADGLVKIYGKRRVVDGVSFHVNKGEIVGLLGPNGAGKTTSFRMVCGLISSNGGIVHLGPHDITNWPMYRRSREGGMGYLPQDKSVFQKLSVQNNLLAVMEMIGIKKQERMIRCDELLEKFKLTHLRRNMGGSLSGGEKRRLEIARALVSNPKIILLDEPFAAVDPITVTSIQSIIRQLSIDGISILITDHSVQDTLQITHRSYVIRAGQVLCHGTPEEVLSNSEARKVYFGENVSVGQIKSTPLHSVDSLDSINNNSQNNKIFINSNRNNTQNENKLPITNTQQINQEVIFDTKNADSRFVQSGIVKSELLSDNKSSSVILSRDRGIATGREVIKDETNHKSKIIRPQIDVNRQVDVNDVSDDFVTPPNINSPSSINNNINQTRPATRRLTPSSSSIILPPNDRPTVRHTPQDQQQKQNDTPSASGIMRVLGAMFFKKDD